MYDLQDKVSSLDFLSNVFKTLVNIFLLKIYDLTMLQHRPKTQRTFT